MSDTWPGGLCEYCGADEGRCYTDCPTIYKTEMEDIIRAQAAQIERLKDLRANGCCCTFEDDGETPVVRCSIHAAQAAQIEMLRKALKNIRTPRVGPDFDWSHQERENYWVRIVTDYRKIASKALEDTQPEPPSEGRE